MNLLHGLSLTETETDFKELHELFNQATVVEEMPVALNNMQVSVCTFQGREDTRTGITRFRKNIISFPQRVSELQQQLQFVSSVAPGDVVNIFTGCAAEPLAPLSPACLRGLLCRLCLRSEKAAMWSCRYTLGLRSPVG